VKRWFVALLACGGAWQVGCAPGLGAERQHTTPVIAGYGREPGMPIGAGAAGGMLEAELQSVPVASRAAPGAVAKAPDPANEVVSPPCTGCVELQVYVNDINQRDRFAFDVPDLAITRVTWTVLVTFNSDQLAVQSFVDKETGKYTALHVNTFPLGVPVVVEQTLKKPQRGPHQVGLEVGSSGAWTGDQTMSVFIDSVKVEGRAAEGGQSAAGDFQKAFAVDDEGLTPRTDQRQPRIVVHPEAGGTPVP
jgi:hypothetical protein